VNVPSKETPQRVELIQGELIGRKSFDPESRRVASPPPFFSRERTGTNSNELDRDHINSKQKAPRSASSDSFLESDAKSFVINKPSPSQSLVIVKALYNYEPQHEMDLSLKEGDLVKLLEKHPSGWWEGEINGKMGYFPSNFVGEENKYFYVQALYDYNGEKGRDLNFKAGEKILVLDDSNPSGWWKGEMEGMMGFFPSNFVEKVSQ